MRRLETTTKKLESLFDFCETLNFNQMICYSDEGNLHSRHCLLESCQKTIDKPVGLWFSYGSAWPEFLHGYEKPWSRKRLNSITHIYELKLHEDRILNIDTLDQFDAFEKEFSTPSKSKIYWTRVAKRYSGIRIKFQINRSITNSKNNSEWYWDWDLSSGCVWDKSGIKSLVLLKAWEPLYKSIKVAFPQQL